MTSYTEVIYKSKGNLGITVKDTLGTAVGGPIVVFIFCSDLVVVLAYQVL